MQEEKTKLLSLTNDYVFKRTFGYLNAKEVTRVFIRDILLDDVSDIDLNNQTITEKELMDDKVGIMDIKAVLNGVTSCDIEVQVVNQADIEKRILFYWSKMYAQTIKQGEKYEDLKKSICVLIVDFEFKKFKDMKKYITKWNIREEEYQSVILTDAMEIYIIELPKYLKYAEKSRRKNFNLWAKFIKNPEVIIMSNENDKQDIKETKQAINKAKKNLEQISKDEHERYLAELREKYIRDQIAIQKYGYEEGKEQGQKEKAIEVAKKMLEEKMSIETIIKITGLTEEDIENLQK